MASRVARALSGVAVVATMTVALLVPAQPASATNSLVATPTTTVRVTPGATAQLNGLNISGDTTDALEATVATDNGTITILTTTGVTLAYGNSWTNTASVSFTGTQAAIDTALGTVYLRGATSGTAHVSLTANVLQSNYNFASPNGHFFQYVSSPGISWFDADTAAKALSFGGQPGYLATIPTAAINTFISTKISGATDIWFGARAYESGATDGTATSATYNGTTYARVWRWTEGADESPIAGNAITACTADNQSSSTCSTVGGYAGWVYGEPNDARGTLSPAYQGEYVGVTNWSGGSGNWNDIGPTYANDLANINGYVVEYGGKTNTNDPSLGTGFGDVVTSTTSVLIAGTATVPSAPVLTGTAGGGQATLTWSPPVSGGATITGYQLSTDGGGTWNTVNPTVTTGIVNGNSVITETSVITGLTNGTPYPYRVRAVNSVGNGTASNTVTVTPGAVPDAPTSPVATRGNTTASVAFAAPGNIGGFAISQYTATATPGGATDTCTSSPCSVTGLTNGTAYTFTVHATNAIGTGLESAATAAVTPATVPGAPTGVSAARANAGASVSFTAPSAGGDPISGYTVTASPGGATTSCSVSPCAITGLTNGTAYTFVVHATNGVGSGSDSSASAAVTPATVPDAPTAVTATRGNTTASVAFTAPVNTGGSAIVNYTVTSSPGSSSSTCVSSPCTVSGLTNGTLYSFTVVASNAIGSSVASAAASATPATVPGTPTAVTATRGNSSASVAFTAPDAGGDPITGYTVTTSPGGATTSCSSSPCAITGLTNGTAYTFVVHATNGLGSGADSAASASMTPATVPGAPTAVTPTRGTASVSVAFTAPASNGGAAISSYTATSAPGGFTGSCAVSPCVVNGLTNGTAYTFTVRATNSVSTGTASTASIAVTPATVPDAPTGVTAVRGNASATVTFTAPAANGDAISGYTVTRSPGVATSACTSSPCTITGLTNGSAYTFTVHATNSLGNSAESSVSNSVTPGTVAGAPTLGGVARGNAQATVSFAAPASNGGDAIAGYRVTASPGGAATVCTNSPCTLTGLTNGTSYTLAVSAITSAGDGTPAVSPAVVPVTVPGAPGNAQTTSLDGALRVRWSAPADTGGDAITGYRLSVSPGTGTVICTASPCTIPGLANGTLHTVRVIASNTVGDGAAATASGIPAGVPAAPTGLSVAIDNGSATLTFTAPDDRGAPITGYEVSTDGGLDWQTATTSGSGPLRITVGGLTNGVPVDLQVRARNAAGAGLAADPGSLTPATTPGAASDLTALAEPGAVSLSWHQPTTAGGSPITGYTVTAAPGGATCTTVVATQCTIRSLTNGTRYTFTITATNAVGDSVASASATATPIAVPAAPTDVTATAGRGAATVTFTAPEDTGGSSVTGYIVRGGPATLRCAASPCRVADLADGASYRFAVAAVNAAGTGPRSAPANPVTPADLPGVPTAVHVTPGDGTATLTFTAPDDHGSPIDHFEVSTDGGATWHTVGGSGSGTITVALGALTSGSAHGVVVRAVNAVGRGAASAVHWVTPTAAAPVSAPAAPPGVHVTSGDGRVTVTFGSAGPVVVTVEPGGRRVTCVSSPCAIDGLQNGTTYGFRVGSVDGLSAASAVASTSITPKATPLVVGPPNVTPSTNSVLVSWGTPVAMPHVSITGYVVTASPGGATCTPVPVTATSCVMRGLKTGEVYSFTISVHATGGHSTRSAKSRSIVLTALVAPHVTPPTAAAAAAVPPTLLPIGIGVAVAIVVLAGLGLLHSGRRRRQI